MTVKQATAALAKAQRDDEAKAARLRRIMERAEACGAKRYAAALAADVAAPKITEPCESGAEDATLVESPTEPKDP